MNYKFFITIFTCLTLAMSIQSCAKSIKDPADVAVEERALVESTILDADRVAQFLSVLDDRDQLVSEQLQLRSNYSQSMQLLNSDYDANRAAFEQLLTNYREESVQTLRQMIAQIEQMKSITTAAEWKVIADYQLDNQPRSRLLGQRSTGEI